MTTITTLDQVHGIKIVRMVEAETADRAAELDIMFGTTGGNYDLTTYGLRYLDGSFDFGVLPVKINDDADAMATYRNYIERGASSGRLDLSTGAYTLEDGSIWLRGLEIG
jgi:hypothetical protein